MLCSAGIVHNEGVETRRTGVVLSQGLTFEDSAAILGSHFSNLAVLIPKGDPTSTGKRGGSLPREHIEALCQASCCQAGGPHALDATLAVGRGVVLEVLPCEVAAEGQHRFTGVILPSGNPAECRADHR
jgi:hypothetical protein